MFTWWLTDWMVALLASGKHIQTIENVLGDNFLSLSNWLIDNKLSLHLDKTESILFGAKHMLLKHSKLAISCGNNVITSKTVIRYLGIDLEQTLSGTAIFENILTKIFVQASKIFEHQIWKIATISPNSLPFRLCMFSLI